MAPLNPNDKSPPSLPLEIISEIFSYMHRSKLLNLRFLSRAFGKVATDLAFRHVVLGAAHGEADRFLKIAFCDRLRPLVKGITIDPWIGPDHKYSEHGRLFEDPPVDNYRFPEDFMDAVPYLQLFKGLRRLHVRFQEAYDPSLAVSDDEHSDIFFTVSPVEESTDFRYRVLDIVFQCLAGTWSKERQYRVDCELDGLGSYHGSVNPEVVDDGLPLVSTTPILIEAITITNLACHDDKRLTSSASFKKVLSFKSLVDLRLRITEHDTDDLENLHEWEMYERLPRTWLIPSLAMNLKILSVFASNTIEGFRFFGWCPRMDFREVQPDFPHLKILALGGYMFSHEWQVDWIATLGQENASGGLEELYLFNYTILYSASVFPSCQAHASKVIGKDDEGKELTISNEGYITKDLILDPDIREEEQSTVYFPLRWHTVLSMWRENMKALRVFSYRMPHERPTLGEDPEEWENDKEYRELVNDPRYTDELHLGSISDKKLLSHLVNSQDFIYFRSIGESIPMSSRHGF